MSLKYEPSSEPLRLIRYCASEVSRRPEHLWCGLWSTGYEPSRVYTPLLLPAY